MTPPLSDQSQRRPLPVETLESVEGWGMLQRSPGYVYRPSTADGILAVLELARSTGHTVSPRGTGYSYGDASLNREGIVLDTTRLNRILAWDPASGLISVEPGVTVRGLWQHTVEDGWWPAVVPGAMFPTIAGCAAVNAHGKNNWRAGSFASHVTQAEVVVPSGERMTIRPGDDLWDAMMGGIGMLGVFTSLTLQLKRIESGLLRVTEWVAPDLAAMFQQFEAHVSHADYMVGWIDAFATGASLGRGLVQVAEYVHDDPSSHDTLRASSQDLPDTILGLFPRSKLWLGLKPTVNDPGMRMLNAARFTLGRRRSGRSATVPHAQFQFFHDFVPGWKRSWKPGGILQYQVFVPAAQAERVFATLLERSRAAGHTPYLVVFKRHRRDEGVLQYSLDGYSLSLDYHATASTIAPLTAMLRACTREVVLPAGGKFYFAKDSLLDRDDTRTMLGSAAVDKFLAIKLDLDPDGLLQSDLYRRVFLP